MLFTTLLAPLALLALPFTEAKYRPKYHEVTVGGAAGLVYHPNKVYAQPGDYVRFHFQFKNHTVTQSSFDDPCTPLHGGFTSGFKPVAMDAKKFPTFKVEVHDFLKKAKALAYDDYKKRSEVDEEPEEVSAIEQRDIISRITGKAGVVSESDE
ncbi:hypothetical protein FRC00_000335 [Tulasnella sp. 408]|nr:hypothetical protein FRC00_000335 [Tulasnella sp. 408]